MKASNTGTTVRIWDAWIRIFHWSLVLSVGFLLISGNTGFQFFEWHRKVGEFVLALLLFRLVWGLFGSSNARLLSLIKHPRDAVMHLVHLVRGNVEQERGHNAAGSWAVVAMIFLLSFQAISGMFIADEDELVEGAFYGLLSSDLSNTLYSLHHTNAELLMILLGVHVIMVFAYLIRAGQNLITPMITGHMKWLSDETPPVVKYASNIVGLILFVICVAFVAWLVGWIG